MNQITLPKGKNKKVIGLMKNEFGEKNMIKFVALRVKVYSYLIDDVSEDKKAKGTKACDIGRFEFENYKNCLEATHLDNKMNYLKQIKSIQIVLKNILRNS